MKNGKLMTDGKSGDAILPVVVVKVDGITCRALVDSGLAVHTRRRSSLIS